MFSSKRSPWRNNVRKPKKICSVDPSGELKSEFEISQKWRCGAARIIAKDEIRYVGSVDGFLYALRGSSGPAEFGWGMKRHDGRGAP